MRTRRFRAPMRSKKTSHLDKGWDYVRNGGGNNDRRFHVPETELDDYRDAHKRGDPFPNPHRSGWYHYIIESLKLLGLDQRHEWGVFKAKVQELMSGDATKNGAGQTLWDRASGRTNDTSLDQRLLQNVEVLQRFAGNSPYGLRIHQIAQQVLGRRGGCIDLEEWDGKLFIRLNLQPETIQLTASRGASSRIPVPINQTKRLAEAPHD